MEYLNLEEIEAKSELFRLLSHPSRLCIVTKLALAGEKNVKGMQNCLNEPQSTVSQHLSKLKSAGIIKGERKGTEIYYRLVDEETMDLIKIIFKKESME